MKFKINGIWAATWYLTAVLSYFLLFGLKGLVWPCILVGAFVLTYVLQQIVRSA